MITIIINNMSFLQYRQSFSRHFSKKTILSITLYLGCALFCLFSYAEETIGLAQKKEESVSTSKTGKSAYSDSELEQLFPGYVVDEVIQDTKEKLPSSVVETEISDKDDIEYDHDQQNEIIEDRDEVSEEVIIEFYETDKETFENDVNIEEGVSDNENVIPENVEVQSDIEVLGTQQKLPSFKINLKRSSTTISRDQIERQQAANVMELMESMAGITAAGGARTSGQGFNIRGFSDNEDILIQIDGARQNFERYRYGSGVDIEPELLQQVEVIRGNSVRTAGSGTVGGAVIMETKNARDILYPGQKAGLKLKTSYLDNNNQKKASVTAYAQPLKFADAILNIVKNDSNDITLPDKTRLPDSKSNQFGAIAKVGIFQLDYDIDLSYRYSDESSLEASDATGGLDGVPVKRDKLTRSPTININFDPEPLWLNLDLSIAYNDQSVKDLFIEGSREGETDLVDYKIINIELKNRSDFSIGSVLGMFDYGLQYNREVRDFLRIDIDGDFDFVDSQPPGKKLSYGGFIDSEFIWKNLAINAGVRYDEYSVTAGGNTVAVLQDQNRSLENGFDTINYGTGLSYRPLGGPLQFFYNYSTSFRAPLIDEYYAVGSTSRCQSFSSFAPQPEQGATPPFIYFLTILPAWQADPFNNLKASCGNFYEPEKSQTHEIGFSADWSNLFDGSADFTSKVTFFLIETTNLIESIYQNTVTGEISQPGEETRWGMEVEMNYDSDTWFSSLAVSVLGGDILYNYFDNNSNETIQARSDEDRGATDLFDVPGDTISLTLGRHVPSHFFEYGYRLHLSGSRIASNVDTDNTIPGCPNSTFFTIPSCIPKEELGGYATHELFFKWEPTDHIRAGLNIKNLTNKQYSTQGFGTTGVHAAGRDIRVFFEYTFR
jgi:hemoglobin/transferrin/lactoferrin receptor protein